MMAELYRDILAAVPGLRNGKSGWTGRCPAHDDRHPSLSLSVGRNGDLLVRCHARHGCTFPLIARALGFDERDFFHDRHERARSTVQHPKPREVAWYDYTAEDGELLYQEVRFEPGFHGRSKDFRQRRLARPDDLPDLVKDGWVWDLDGCPRVLYRLPDLLTAFEHGRDPRVFIPEGAGKVEALARIGVLATTNVCGAQAPWLPEYSRALRGRRVVLLPDNDLPGQERAVATAASLMVHGPAASIRILHLPGLEPKGDVVNWLRGFPRGTPIMELRRSLYAQVLLTQEWRSYIAA